jgi:hypothetical protein
VLRRCAPELERDAAGLAAALKHEGVGAVGIMFWTRFQANWVYVLPFAVGGATPHTARSKGAWAHTYSSRLACPGELTLASMRKARSARFPLTRAWVQVRPRCNIGGTNRTRHALNAEQQAAASWDTVCQRSRHPVLLAAHLGSVRHLARQPTVFWWGPPLEHD